MKKVILFIIKGYQVIISPFIHQLVGIGPGQGCRFEETCSHYASRMIGTYGILRGSQLAAKRILACQSLKK